MTRRSRVLGILLILVAAGLFSNVETVRSIGADHVMMKAGRVTPVIDRSYALSALPEAIRYLEDGHAPRKSRHQPGVHMIRRIGSLLSATLIGGLVTVAGTGGASAQDPAVVNAKTIQVELENSRVRVLEAVLKPGEKENTHSHPAYVVYVIEGGKIRNHASYGSVSEAEFKAGESVLYRDPLTHWAENIGNTTIHLILVELKGSN